MDGMDFHPAAEVPAGLVCIPYGVRSQHKVEFIHHVLNLRPHDVFSIPIVIPHPVPALNRRQVCFMGVNRHIRKTHQAGCMILVNVALYDEISLIKISADVMRNQGAVKNCPAVRTLDYDLISIRIFPVPFTRINTHGAKFSRRLHSSFSHPGTCYCKLRG